MFRLLVILTALIALQGCRALQGVATAGDTNIRAGAATVKQSDAVQNAADIEASEALRRAILADPSMSVDARNIFIITQNGNMTLRGAVNDDMERGKIKEMAARVPEVKVITDELQLPAQTIEADSPIGQGGGDVKSRSQAGR